MRDARRAGRGTIGSSTMLLGATAMMLTGCSADPTPAEPTTIGSVLGAYDWEAVDWQSTDRAIQELIAQCMREQGWDYTPALYPQAWYDFLDSEPPTFEEQRALIAERGFGYVWSRLHPDEDRVIENGLEDWVDPNQAYLDSLTATERAAYDATLNGSREEQEAYWEQLADPAGSGVTAGWGPGCTGEATLAVRGHDPSLSEAYWTATAPFSEELEERIQADPRMVALVADWSRCMGARGFTYESINAFPVEVNTYFESALTDLGALKDPTSPFLGWSEDEIAQWEATTSEADQEAFFQEHFAPTAPADSRPALEALLQEEIALATANWDCLRDYNDQVGGIRADIEEQYVRDHQAELLALAAQFGIGRD